MNDDDQPLDRGARIAWALIVLVLAVFWIGVVLLVL